MRLARRLCLSILAGLLVPAPASAEPSFAVGVTPALLRDWHTPVQYRLTITAGASAEHFELHVNNAGERGPGLTPVGAGLAEGFGCPRSRWRTARSQHGGSYDVFRVDLEPGQSTYVTAGAGLPGPPWPADELSFAAYVSAAPGAEAPQTTQISHPGPLLRLPRGVPIALSAAPGPAGWIAVRGSATGLPAGERVRIKAFPPDATGARLVATARVGRHGRFRAAFPALRDGIWDVYASYRSRLPELASDASPCSVQVRLGPAPQPFP